MVDHPAREHDVVAFHGQAVEPDFSAVGGHAGLDHVFAVCADVVHYRDAFVNIFGNNGHVLFAGHGPVGARGREDVDVGVEHAAGVEALHHGRDVDVGRLPQARGVRSHNADSLAGFDDLLQTGGANGVVQGVVHMFAGRALR